MELETLANLLQVLNYAENKAQSSNDHILYELQRQNKDYLEKILEILKNDKK